MNTASIHIIQGQIPKVKSGFALLKNGSLVTGRVMGKNPDGSYNISLAGQKINVKSELALKEGSVFQSKVIIKNGQVQLSLVKEVFDSDVNVQKTNFLQEGISPKISELLLSLGFEVNTENLKILQFMQQMGMKFDITAAKRALVKARKDGESDEEKAQIYLLLDKKGLPSDEESVNAILGNGNGNGNGNERQKREQKKNPENEKNKQDKKNIKITNYIDSVKSYFKSLDSAAEKNEKGILTAFNSFTSRQKDDSSLQHWFVFPFEWAWNKSWGNIKLLFDSELKNLEKLVIDLKNTKKNNIFVLYYKNNEVDSVRFSSDASENSRDNALLSNELKSMLGKNINVTFSDYNSLKGFCSDDETFSLVEGLV